MINTPIQKSIPSAVSPPPIICQDTRIQSTYITDAFITWHHSSLTFGIILDDLKVLCLNHLTLQIVQSLTFPSLHLSRSFHTTTSLAYQSSEPKHNENHVL